MKKANASSKSSNLMKEFTFTNMMIFTCWVSMNSMEKMFKLILKR